MALLRDRGPRSTGWIRDGHSIDIEVDKEGGTARYYLNHPDACRVTEHAEDESAFFGREWHCMIGFESNYMGICKDNHWSAEEPGEPLPEQELWLGWAIDDLGGVASGVPIEYSVYHGVIPGGPWGPEEYEWICNWRIVQKNRDEDLATPAMISESQGWSDHLVPD